MLPLALFSDKLPVDDRRAFADTILQNKPADQPLKFPQLRFGTGFVSQCFLSSLQQPDRPILPTKTAGSECTR